MARSIRTDIENNGKVDFLSKPLLRTNPKLSSNIKLVVSNDDLFLESINADPKLAGSSYKKFRLKPDGSYSYDVSKFWNDNKTPSDLIFKVKRNYSDFSILNTYDQQFEEDYSCGASVNSSKLYTEQFKIMAPIWLDKNIPSRFVIYRVNDAVSDKDFSGLKLEKKLKVLDIVSNSTIIKTFDLTNDSNIGKYIRRHVGSVEFPESPMTVSFEKSEKTFYNGLDLVKGGFVSKGEFHHKSTVDTDKPLIEYNDFITDGFSRNEMVCANLINLEFMFNDDEAEEFSINRYFGLFVDEHEIGEGLVKKIDGDIVTFSEISHNLQGISNDWMSLPYQKFFNEKPLMGWVKSSDNLHNVKNGASWNSEVLETAIDSNGQDYSQFLGIKETGNDIEVFKNEGSDSDFLKIEVTGIPNNGDRIEVVNLNKQSWTIRVLDVGSAGGTQYITDNSGASFTWTSTGNKENDLNAIKNAWPTTSTFGKYSSIVKYKKGDWVLELYENEINMEQDHGFVSSNSFGHILSIKQEFKPIDVIGSTFFADSSLPKGKTSGKNWSNQGSFKNIANAISEVIKENTRFTTIIKDETVYIKSPIKGYNRLDDALLFDIYNANFLTFGTPQDINNLLEISPNYLTTRNSYAFSGGSNSNQSLYIEEDDDDSFSVGDYLLDSKNRFNKIIDVVEDSRTINTEFKKIILERKNDGINGVNGIYADFKLKWGYFGAYDVYDLNFDFYDTENSNIKELNYEKPGVPETILGNTTLGNVNGYWGYVNTQNDKSAYSNMDNMEMAPLKYYSNLIPLLKGEEDFIKYESVSGIQAENQFINSEFERLQENNTTQFSTISRVVPFINKWVLKDSLNVRENPYYLNTSEVFGNTNFAPDLSKEERDPKGMTHEWFYIDKIPRYHDIPANVPALNSYINPTGDIQLDRTDFHSITHDYFKSYFLSNGLFTEGANPVFAHTSVNKKYTYISGGGNSSFASTIFKGIKFTPKVRKEKLDGNIGSPGYNAEKTPTEFIESSEFNGYRFSAVLKTNFHSSYSNEVKVKVIQNKKFKFLILYLDLYLSDSNIEWIDRRMMYELDHKLKDDNGSLVYDDTILTGALDLSVLPSVSTGPSTISGISVGASNPQFDTQILKDPETGKYGDIIISNLINNSYRLKVSNVIDSNTLLVEGGLNIIGTTTYQTINPLILAAAPYADYTYEGGGVGAHTSLLNQLCPKNISELLKNATNVGYETIEVDGTYDKGRFILEMEDGNEVIKKSTLTSNVDTEKPKAFGLSNSAIGYSIEKRKFEYFSFLVRQNGRYTVDMKPVITFSEVFSDQKIQPDNNSWSGEYIATSGALVSTYSFDYTSADEAEISEALYKKLNYCRIQFNLGRLQNNGYTNTDSNWGVINNFFFHKVNEIGTNGVIKLSESDALLPKYNLIGEVAIDRTDKDVFKSRWDSGFYIRSGGGGKKKPVAGTKNIIEEKNFAASAVLKVEEGYDVFNFTSFKYESIEELDSVKLSGNNEFEVGIFEDHKTITMDFDLTSSAVRLLDVLGVRNTINKYVTPEDSFGKIETLDDDVDFYIRENILPLFTLGSIDMYVLPSKKVVTEVEQVVSVGGITVGGYKIDNNYTYEVDSKNPLNFRLIYNKKKGFNYKIRPLIKIQS